MASVGETVRISGEWGREKVDDPAYWDWSEDAVRDCAGFHWMVGDEVSVVTDEPRTVVSDAGIVVPRVEHQEGPKTSPAALLVGRLVLSGRCLRIEKTGGGAQYLVIWPPGFEVNVRGKQVVVVNGAGAVITQVGDMVELSGGESPALNSPDAPHCSGKGWYAYTVRTRP